MKKFERLIRLKKVRLGKATIENKEAQAVNYFEGKKSKVKFREWHKKMGLQCRR